MIDIVKDIKSLITMNRFSRTTKPKQSVNLGLENFPELSNGISTKPAEWKYQEPVIRNDAKIYPSGDIFEGDYDETGNPIYGKVTFANGNIYRGPIHYSWPKDYDDYESTDEECEFTDEYYDEDDGEYEEYYYETRLGVMIYPNGKQFVGVFCFGDEWLRNEQRNEQRN